ncbi:hypothetical protein [Teredinibacter sp. KSP-S5-2]|uniref:hypothetical protein n=1 Tax=Teredinibacter sp. KSP-S5-2 TaxID=3034506 RepID=UPI002934D15B|nr:hypothetical protein [Teredinibacter sp. KSP-S5-2]WNO10798.1 hypothetical protein P5V12_06370 [Teredinibacter sp. KSP-S5-2]
MKYLLTLFLFLSVNVFGAWAGQLKGKIALTEVAHDEPYSFRVSLKGQPALCGNTNNWAYVKKTDSNYPTFVSALLAAKFSGSDVTLYTIVDPDGRCYLRHLSID